MTYKSTCPTCDREFQRIGKHWADGKCDYPTISQEQREIIAGLIMGDGTTCGTGARKRDTKFPYFEVEMTNKDFIWWVAGKLKPLTSNVIERSHEEKETTYRTYTVSHPSLQTVDIWRKMKHPASLPWEMEWTPLILKMLYVSRGRLHWVDGGVNIAIQSQQVVHLLRQLFDEKGWEYSTVKGRPRIYLNRPYTKQFFEYLGEPSTGFEYKWEYE